MSQDNDEYYYKPSYEGAMWRGWDGYFVVYSFCDDSTHLIDPVGCLVFEELLNAEAPVLFSSLVSRIQQECGPDLEPTQVETLLGELLPQLQSIGLIEARLLR